jgi:uncharacterized membrane protein YqiK
MLLVRLIILVVYRAIYVQHRGNGALVRKLNSLGLKAYSDKKSMENI